MGDERDGMALVGFVILTGWGFFMGWGAHVLWLWVVS
jgi:hypothetical protein